MYQEHVQGEQTGMTTQETVRDENAEVSPTDAFLAEMARAMQMTADRERERLAAAASTEMTSFVERVRTRGAAEAAQLRRLAEEDVERIGSWSVTEIERIHRETDRQIEARRSRLEEYLVQHSSLIEHEIGRIQSAVEAYHDELSQFVNRLGDRSDVAAIAQLAGTVPAPPNLEKVASVARGELVGGIVEDQARSRAAAAAAVSTPAPSLGSDYSAEAGREPVGVMDPQAQPQATPSTPTSAVDPSRSHENGTAVRLLRALAPWTAPAERSQESVSIPLDSRAASAAEAEAQTAVETTVSGEGNGASAEGSPQPTTEERRDDTTV